MKPETTEIRRAIWMTSLLKQLKSDFTGTAGERPGAFRKGRLYGSLSDAEAHDVKV